MQISAEHPNPSHVVDYYLLRGPINVRTVNQTDDEGNRFLEATVLCRSIGHGPYCIKLVGKRWNVNMTEEEELLTDNERRTLGIGDEEWLRWSGNTRFMEEEVDGANGRQ